MRSNRPRQNLLFKKYQTTLLPPNLGVKPLELPALELLITPLEFPLIFEEIVLAPVLPML